MGLHVDMKEALAKLTATQKRRCLPKDALVAQRYAAQMAELQQQRNAARANLQARTAEMLEYEAETLKVIRGESRLNSDLLNKLYEQAKEDCSAAEEMVEQCENALKASAEHRASLEQQFDNMQSWATLFGECDMATKKMIVANLMRSVRVKRDYEIEIDLAVDCEQLGLAA